MDEQLYHIYVRSFSHKVEREMHYTQCVPMLQGTQQLIYNI